MLILPIVNKNRVMNVEIKLKNASKIRSGVYSDDVHESDIIVNREKFSDSSFKESRDEAAPTDFIRSISILHPRNFLVTTKQENDTNLFDVYEVAQPPRKVNASLDKLYGKAITDLRKEIPGVKGRGRYVSFEKLGMDKYLTEEKIASLQRIVKDERDSSRWPKLFQEAGIADLGDTVDFINTFECTVLSDTSIPEDSLKDTIKQLEVINTKDYRNLKNYYKMAKTNTNIYTKISYINNIINEKPLTLIQAKKEGRQYIKKDGRVDYNKAA